MQTEIGYTYAIVDVLHDSDKVGEIYYGVCNKTGKVAHIYLNKLYVMMVNSTHIDDEGCFDCDSCLNVDCEYCTSDNWEERFQKSQLKYDNSISDLDYEKYLANQKKNIEWVENHISKHIHDLKDISNIKYVNLGTFGE